MSAKFSMIRAEILVIAILYSVKINSIEFSTGVDEFENVKTLCSSNYEVAGKDLFKSCQPENCRTKDLKGHSINHSMVDDTTRIVWINAFVVRSPVMKYKGCYKVNVPTQTIHKLPQQQEDTDNDVLKCSRFCKSVGYSQKDDVVLLQEIMCLCTKKTHFKELLSKDQVKEVPTSNCSKKCPGDKRDRCGPTDYVSAYEFTNENVDDKNLGITCFYTASNRGANIKPKRINCFEKLKFKCQAVDAGDGFRNVKDDICFQWRLDWYSAEKKCRELERYLPTYTPPNKKCFKSVSNVDEDDNWHNTFTRERIIWNTEKNPRFSHECLAIEVHQNMTYKLLAADCKQENKALCVKKSQTETTTIVSSQQETTTVTVTSEATAKVTTDFETVSTEGLSRPEDIKMTSSNSKGVNALQVSMNSDITTAIGDTDVELTCQVTTENDDFVNLIYLTARNKTTDSFYRIVTFYPPHRNKEASLSTGGEYLSGRVSLTNPTSDTSAAIMSYKNPVQCEDDTDYRCDIHYDNNGQLETMQSDPTTITITSPSSKPDSVTMYPFTGISHEDYVSFICEGNVGNPAGKFVWRKHLAGEHNPVVYSDPVTVSSKIQDSCSYHGTSNLTIQLTEDDNGATISCVEQSYQLETMMRKTSPLNIHYKVINVVISKDPDVETHIRDPMNQINLTCVAEGNPAPFYNWYKEPDLETVLSSGDTFIIKEMLTNKSGIYRCKAYHYIKGAMYSEEQMVNVTIVEDSNKMPSRGDPNTKSGSTVIIVVILSLLVVIAVVVLSYIYYRIKNKESSDLKEVLSKLKCQQVFSRIKCPQSFPRIKCPQSFPRVTCPQFLRRRGSDSKVGSGESWAESDRSSIHTDHNIDLSPDYSTVIDENETIDTIPKAHPRKNHYDDVVLQLDEKSSQQRNRTVPTSGDHFDDDILKSADDSKLYTNAKLVDQNKLTKSTDLSRIYASVNKRQSDISPQHVPIPAARSKSQLNIDHIEFADAGVRSRPHSFIGENKLRSSIFKRIQDSTQQNNSPLYENDIGLQQQVYQDLNPVREDVSSPYDVMHTNNSPSHENDIGAENQVYQDLTQDREENNTPYDELHIKNTL